MPPFLNSIKEKMMTAQQFSGSSSGKSKSGSLFRRNSKYRTELTPFEDAPADAPWKIQNILVNGPPNKKDWFKTSHKKKTGESTDTVTTDKESDTGSSDVSSQRNNNNNNSNHRLKFHNVGRKNWEKARKEWRKPKVENRPPPPPPVRYDEVVRGLLQVQRTYELPGPMTLPDIISVFRDIWDCENDF